MRGFMRAELTRAFLAPRPFGDCVSPSFQDDIQHEPLPRDAVRVLWQRPTPD